MNIEYPVRININSSLSPTVDHLVRTLNQCFLRAGCDDIDFSPSSSHIPHLTLLMGTVHDSRSLAEIGAHCEAFALHTRKIEFSLSKPFWKKPSLKFMFLDAEPYEPLKELRTQLLDELSGLIECEFHGGPENPSHITVGYGSERQVKLSQVRRLYSETVTELVDLRIALAGERGTCHSILESFPFAA